MMWQRKYTQLCRVIRFFLFYKWCKFTPKPALHQISRGDWNFKSPINGKKLLERKNPFQEALPFFPANVHNLVYSPLSFYKDVILIFEKEWGVSSPRGLCVSVALSEDDWLNLLRWDRCRPALQSQMSLPLWLLSAIIHGYQCSYSQCSAFSDAGFVDPAALSAFLGSINKTGGNFCCPVCHVLIMGHQQCHPALHPDFFSHACYTPVSLMHFL